MALKAAAFCLVVTPTGDSDQREQGRLVVVENRQPERKVFRGVVESVGERVQTTANRGDIAHYTGYHEIVDGRQDMRHVVPEGNLIAIEDDE